LLKVVALKPCPAKGAGLHATEAKPYERETIMDQNQLLDAIRVNLEVIYGCLDEAIREVDEALTAIEQGNQNAAIGAILEVPERLEDIKSFYDGVMSLHHNSQRH
jgi:hypothetical protein